jgi:hypothetical protein
MKLVCHGGGCCGVKTIHDMGNHPDAIHAPLRVMAKPPRYYTGRIQAHWDCRSGKRFFPFAAPKETGTARLDRFLAFLDEERPQGVVEIVLAQSPGDENGQRQRGYWHKTLLKRKFKQVTVARNSNSGNDIYIYHRKGVA